MGGDMEATAKTVLKKATPKCLFKEKQISKQIKAARNHWADNRDIYEHDISDLKSNPLFGEKRFASFLHGSADERNIKKGRHDELRKALVAGLTKALQDDSGNAIDNLEGDLRRRFSSHKPPQRVISIVSEIAAFLRPKRFVVWDRFAIRGLNRTLGRGASNRYKNYKSYLADFELAWTGEPGEQVREYINSNSREIKGDMKSDRLPNGLEKKPKFQRQVLGYCLTKVGQS
jgi:hypothetical protein